MTGIHMSSDLKVICIAFIRIETQYSHGIFVSMTRSKPQAYALLLSLPAVLLHYQMTAEHLTILLECGLQIAPFLKHQRPKVVTIPKHHKLPSKKVIGRKMER